MPPLRSSSSSVSRLWVNEAISEKPNVALPPLIECATRKMVLISSGVGRADVELQQRRLHRVERLEALLEEGVVKLCQVDRHAGLSCESGSAACGETEKPGGGAKPARAAPFDLAARDSRSRTNAAMSCRPAVSMRCTALTSRVTGRRALQQFAARPARTARCGQPCTRRRAQRTPTGRGRRGRIEPWRRLAPPWRSGELRGRARFGATVPFLAFVHENECLTVTFGCRVPGYRRCRDAP